MKPRQKTSPRTIYVCLAGVALLLWSVGCQPSAETPLAEAEQTWPELERYVPMVIPADNPMTVEKVALGKQLFHDERLSADGSRSCYSCHVKENGLTDGLPKAIGAYETPLPRSSPTLWNIGYHSEFYWDGRSGSLEGQALAAWRGGNMGASGQNGRPSVDDIAARINEIRIYGELFETVFGGPATPDNIVKAIAAFERTIVSTDSAWVRFQSDQTDALSEQARRGWEIFDQKAQCTNCHSGLLLTDLQYHNVGIGMEAADPDGGRFAATNAESDTGAFKTPTLLDISKSAPYFHDGSAATLEESVDILLGGGIQNPHLDTVNLQPMQLTAAEKDDLLAFLRSLDVNYDIAMPTLP